MDFGRMNDLQWMNGFGMMNGTSVYEDRFLKRIKKDEEKGTL